ncbi:methyl-accepting chemotaxis protein [Geomonas sp. RF6]|uniref:methyl-accepting chemotaxis protein n=1 Tax=Geomonas sp. RF6 TaxID=2897342 RepID=UPI001E5D6346|nr:methyl-accepting chemotaxis protein [Geomonas sp. RF6]UFS71918.1 methyl-accepting chemotaxis protein [Geomonas sp. RF6]
MKLSHKIFLANLLLLMIGITTTSLFALDTFKREFVQRAAVDLEQRMRCLHELLGHKGHDFAVVQGKLLAGSYVINDNFELPDRIKAIFGGSATIFMGDLRVSTNVLKGDGSRAIGTRLQGAAHDTVLNEGKPYRGEAVILGEPYFTAYDPIRNAAGEVIGILYVGVKQSEYLAGYNRLHWILIGMAAFLAATLSFLSLLLVRRSLRPLRQMVEVNRRLADGDLSVEIEMRGSDEIGQLAESSRKVLHNLNALIASIKETASQVASSSSILNSVCQQISSNSELVVQQIVTVATASEEMSATSLGIARSCTMAADSSDEGSKVATAGVAVVRETVAGMQRISEKVIESGRSVRELGCRSDQIGEIICTIEDIADQTNLLALNAAIEAARAGEQGRGFAVVADEVRALAARTARATREIGSMIKGIQDETRSAVSAMEESVSEVEKGSTEAARSGDALAKIQDQINAVSQQINQIAIAAEEQTATTSEITVKILQVTEVMQLNTDCLLDSAAAAGDLSSHADQLLGLVSTFTLAR